MDGVEEDIPELLPARMVNEFVYCPRLFHLEWVSAEWADSGDTVEGRWRHRVVDREPQRMPPEGGLHGARALMLSSPELGLVGRVDIIDESGGEVRPVDYKRGRPPENEHRAHDPERVQLAVLGMLLRDAGYRSDGGVLYFAQSNERVEVPFTEELMALAEAAIAGAWAAAVAQEPPPRLVDSPKCPRCSLVGICLPDEVNLLEGTTARPPRRLIPSADNGTPVYVTTPGARVGKDGNRLVVKYRDEVVDQVRLVDVTQLNLHGNAQVSTQMLRELMDRDIPVCWFTSGGWFSGMAAGLPSKHVELRMRQAAFAAGRSPQPAADMVGGKIRNARTLLRRNSREADDEVLHRLRNLARKAERCDDAGSLLGVEGAAARTYFGAFPTMLREDLRFPGSDFTFEGRRRRPPPDAVNALLSYVYSLLVKDLTAVTWGVGLDPYMGVYHRPRFGRPALALDLAEEFRPLIADSVVIGAINNGELRPPHFIARAGGVSLTPDGRKAIIAAYERRMATEVTHPIFGYRITYRRVLEVQARLLGALLLGEVDRYRPFVTR